MAQNHSVNATIGRLEQLAVELIFTTVGRLTVLLSPAPVARLVRHREKRGQPRMKASMTPHQHDLGDASQPWSARVLITLGERALIPHIAEAERA
jgi:hypothetical protein